LTFSNNEVVVRWMRTPPVDAPEIARWLDLLDEEESAQAGRFRLAPDRAAYVAAHALLRRTLSVLSPRVPAQSWRFAPDTLGRPQVVPASELRFSVSHCRPFVACAVARGFDLGIDVEDLSRPETQWRDALAFLPDAERAYIEAATGNERRDRFFRLWTLREAFAKASGMGVAQSFEEVAFTLDPPALSSTTGGALTEWRFNLTAERGFMLATACNRDVDLIAQPVEKL
jgi:4'-phosphopantetheinyl transferase